MFLIKICQLRIEIVCRAKRGKFFLKVFLLFEHKKVQFGPHNIIWGLKNGGVGGPGPRAPLPGSATVLYGGIYNNTVYKAWNPDLAWTYSGQSSTSLLVKLRMCIY